MSKIDDLIKQYCPNGVEYKRIDELCIVKTGGDTPKNCIKGQLYPSEEYPYPVYSNGTETYGYADSYRIDRDAVSISSIGNVGYVAYRAAYFTPIIRLKVLLPNTDILTTKFLFYALTAITFVGTNSSLSSMKADDVKKYKIPVPPLPVQEEIVRILDAFTALEAELEAELEARKRQYEYYRNKLLTFDENTTEGGKIKFMQLGDVGTFIRGNGLQKKDFTDTGVGCIHYGQIYTYYGTFAERTKSYVSNELAEKLKKARTGDLIIATTSENVEDVGKAVAWLGNEDICIGGHSYAFHHNQNPKYMAYLFQTEAFNQQKKKVVKGVKVIDINDSAMSKFKFGFPPLDEQERIVAILDKFDSLVNDISEGLPAELTARRQQYEYYRNKLLTFDEAA